MSVPLTWTVEPTTALRSPLQPVRQIVSRSFGVPGATALPAPLPVNLVWAFEHDGSLFLRYRL